jgi:hypothetical protein
MHNDVRNNDVRNNGRNDGPNNDGHKNGRNDGPNNDGHKNVQTKPAPTADLKIGGSANRAGGHES